MVHSEGPFILALLPISDPWLLARKMGSWGAKRFTSKDFQAAAPPPPRIRGGMAGVGVGR